MPELESIRCFNHTSLSLVSSFLSITSFQHPNKHPLVRELQPLDTPSAASTTATARRDTSPLVPLQGNPHSQSRNTAHVSTSSLAQPRRETPLAVQPGHASMLNEIMTQAQLAAYPSLLQQREAPVERSSVSGFEWDMLPVLPRGSATGQRRDTLTDRLAGHRDSSTAMLNNSFGRHIDAPNNFAPKRSSHFLNVVEVARASAGQIMSQSASCNL